MKRFELTTEISRTVIFLLIGAFLGALLGGWIEGLSDILDNKTTLSQTDKTIIRIIVSVIVAILCALCGLAVIFMSTALKLNKEVARDVLDMLTLRAKWISNDADPSFDEGYVETLNIIKRSESEILIIGDFSPPVKNDDGSFSRGPDGRAVGALETGDQRGQYLNTIIDVLKDYKGRSTRMQYRRVIIRSEDEYNDFLNNGHMLDEDVMAGDLQTYVHCWQSAVIAQSRSRKSPNVVLHVTKPVSTIPSILIVDNDHLMFTIPEKMNSMYVYDGADVFSEDEEDRTGRFVNAGVLFLSDNSPKGTELTQHFKGIFTTYEDLDSEIVKKIKRPAIELLSQWGNMDLLLSIGYASNRGVLTLPERHENDGEIVVLHTDGQQGGPLPHGEEEDIYDE